MTQPSTIRAQHGSTSLTTGSELSPQHSFHPWLFAIALLTVLATFPLIFMGGLVTSHAAGLSVPDWPNSFGYNMFRFPPSKWVGGILYEHTHRLMGTVVGFIAIVLVAVAWKVEPRRWVRWLSVAVLGMVIFQGVLGGLRVVWVSLDLAIVHACVAQAFFCLAALMAIVTSRWWLGAPDLSREPDSRVHRRLIAVAVIAVLVVYGQLIVGATMRHFNAGLAIPDLPLAFGKWLPPMNQAQLDAANQIRDLKFNMNPTTFSQIWLHFGHRFGAMVVTIAEITLIGTILRRHRCKIALLRPALILAGLLVVQITLGLLTVYFRKPADIASAHVAVGALVLVTTFVIAVRAMRLYSLRGRMSVVSGELSVAHSQ
jgi:cytochrome c oxidase assembly protein subunit 15